MGDDLEKEIFERVVKVIKEILQVDEEISITLETSIKKDLDADSVDIVSLLMDLEDEFGGDIPEEDATLLDTIGDIVKYIKQRAND